MTADKSRGEIAELRIQLMRLSGGGSSLDKIALKRDLFRKLIILSTTGQDMSGLFMQVITCAASDSQDIILKKSLYLYITTYCNTNPELMLLTINMLLKGCEDQDPTIRGLSLRSLCSLTLANLTEYLMNPIHRGLEDRHPYVRRTAVMGVLKVWNFDRSAVEESGMLDMVRQLLMNDPDPMVISNCMSVIQKAGAVQELLSKALLYSLLNRIKEFLEWAQCQVLEFVSHYTPENPTEVYDIMNALDDRLATPNSAVVLATVKVFLNLTLLLPYDHQQVLERIKDPLLTLITRDHYETAYVVLSHFLILAQRAPVIFSSVYTSFYCRMNDPSYIQDLKLQVLSAVADDNNAYEIVTELTEYVTDIDEHLAREAVRAVGRIALEVQDISGLLDRLLGFLELGKPCVTAETLIHIKDVLRRYPHIAEIAMASLSNLSPQDVDEPEARAAFVWILGEHGSGVQDAPYLLEPLVEDWSSQAVIVRLTVLTAAAKLFFVRPAECQPVLGAALAAAVGDTDQDVHDRGFMYLRLLRHNVDEANRVISPAVAPLPSFAETHSPEIMDRIFAEFNSLSVIYSDPSQAFVKDGTSDSVTETQLPAIDHAVPANGVAPSISQTAGPPADVDEGSSLLGGQPEDISYDSGRPSSANLMQPGPLGETAAEPLVALSPSGAFQEDDLSEQPQQQPPQPSSPDPDPIADLLSLSTSYSAPGPPSALQLRHTVHLQPSTFQLLWSQLQAAQTFQLQLSPAALSGIQNQQTEFCQTLARVGIIRMASGGKPVKFYFHAQPVDKAARLLLEVLSSSSGLSVTIKSEDVALWSPLQTLFTQTVTAFSM